MRIKKVVARPLVLILAVSQCVTANAGTWVSSSPTSWVYQNDDGTYQKGGWFKAPEDGRVYYLNADGIIQFGWQYLEGTWYFLNTVHDGSFGAALTGGWHWIDGYCYQFDNDGRMAVNVITPDGFMVDAEGRWIENGTVVQMPGKGILTQSAPGGTSAVPRHSSSSGGGGGGGSGGGSTAVTYYDYTIRYVDQDGNILERISQQAKKNSFVTILIKEFEGYEFVRGDSGVKKLSKDGAVFTLVYQKTEEKPPPEEIPEEDDKEICGYTIRYMERDTGKQIKTLSGNGKKGSLVIVTEKEISGYQPDIGNDYSFTITDDNMEITFYYTKIVKIRSYGIFFKGSDGKQLGSINGKAVDGTVIEVPEREYKGYFLAGGQEKEFTLGEGSQKFTVMYEKDVDDENGAATPSTPDYEEITYTIHYIDKDTEEELVKETGTAVYGDIILPDLVPDGYVLAADYEFEAAHEGDEFTVYIIREGVDLPEISKVGYTVSCVDENLEEIAFYEGNVFVEHEAVMIRPSYDIPGYVLVGDNRFEVTKDGGNNFILSYEAERGEYKVVVHCVDIDTSREIKKVELYGSAGDKVDVSEILPEGYERIGNPPDKITVSSNPENNQVKLYFKKKADIPPSEKVAHYTVQFRAKNDKETVIMADIEGTWQVGERIPVYYTERMTTPDGKIWKAIDDSPRVFTVRDQEVNQFLIEYSCVGDVEVPEKGRTYSIRYIAQDTGSILGIAAGEASVGDVIPFRNTFNDYGFVDEYDSYVIPEEGDNVVDVILKRVNFPGHDKNPDTGLYDGCEWLTLFVDSNGEELLPGRDGFTVKGDDFYIDYPNTIEKDGITYRAANSAPYQCIIDGTLTRQFIIQFITGDSSEEKLLQWKTAAQKKKDAFFGTTPFSYTVAYKEKNSWNDIGLKFGVANAETEVVVEAEDFPGWIIPNESLGSFKLDENGKKIIVQYKKAGSDASVDYLKRNYTIHFKDEVGNALFDSYKGELAFATGNQSIEFLVYYPDSFYDMKGNRWVADQASPQNFSMSAMEHNEKTVSYHMVYENEGEQFIVKNNSDVNRILNDFATHTQDAERHEFYVIGRDYDPGRAEVGNTVYMNHLAGYTNEVVDRFELKGMEYTISLIGYYHKWNQATCTHSWDYVEDLGGNCASAAVATVRCDLCGKEVNVMKPAVGHVDGNYDSVCDACGEQLKKGLGDEITVAWNSKDLGYGQIKYNFICVDENYQGTGKLLFLSADDLLPNVYGKYTNGPGADYGSSRLRYFLDDEFADGLSVSGVLQALGGDSVSMLTKAEYDVYKAASANQFPFPDGTFLTKSDLVDGVTLSDGRVVSAEEASRYAARPVILLNGSDEEEGSRTGIWNEGDLQAKEIGGKLYLFRCVNENYMDKSNTDKSLALFLCETVIASNEGLGFDEADGTQSTRFFGNNNNYKYSAIHTWLEENKENTGNLVTTNIGIENEYTGKTKEGMYQYFDIRDLNRYTRTNPQVMYSELFIPSVEEAMAMKDYLWRFNDSEKNNASDIMNDYRRAYWLRTPEYGTDDRVYTVNLEKGTIEPRLVNAAGADNYCSIGIRPVYVVEQAY